MFDAWGKIPSGILYGNFFDRGNFDECLEIRHDSKAQNIGIIKGQYCIASIDVQDILQSRLTHKRELLRNVSLTRYSSKISKF